MPVQRRAEALESSPRRPFNSRRRAALDRNLCQRHRPCPNRSQAKRAACLVRTVAESLNRLQIQTPPHAGRSVSSSVGVPGDDLRSDDICGIAVATIGLHAGFPRFHHGTRVRARGRACCSSPSVQGWRLGESHEYELRVLRLEWICARP